MNASAFACDPRLTPSARLLAQILEKKARGYDECWSSTDTLAAALKCCDRTIRNTLRQLSAVGLIQVIRDYSKSSRRRIVLLWKRRSLFPSVAENVSPETTDTFSATNDPPPHPPIGEKLSEDDGGLIGPPPSPAPSPEVSTAAVAELVELAREHVSPAITTGQVEAVIARTNAAPSAVRAALEETKGRAHGRWGYVVGAVRNIVRERGRAFAMVPVTAARTGPVTPIRQNFNPPSAEPPPPAEDLDAARAALSALKSRRFVGGGEPCLRPNPLATPGPSSSS